LRVESPEVCPKLPDLKPMFRLIRRRNDIAASLGLDEPAEIDAVLEEISTLFTRSWLLFSQVDRGHSTAKHLRVLRRMTVDMLSDRHILGTLDNAVVARLGMHVAGGTARLMLH